MKGKYQKIPISWGGGYASKLKSKTQSICAFLQIYVALQKMEFVFVLIYRKSLCIDIGLNRGELC